MTRNNTHIQNSLRRERPVNCTYRFSGKIIHSMLGPLCGRSARRAGCRPQCARLQVACPLNSAAPGGDSSAPRRHGPARPLPRPPDRRSCARRAGCGYSRAPTAASPPPPGRAACGPASSGVATALEQRRRRPRHWCARRVTGVARGLDRARRRDPRGDLGRAFGRRRQDEVGGADRLRPRRAGRCGRAAAPTPWPGNPPRIAARARRRAPASPRWPQRHGFIAAISWTRAGKVTCALARATLTVPVSSGWRSESSTARWNSGSSSRNSTPRCARLTSPGLHPQPAADQRRHRRRMMRRADTAACASAARPSSVPATACDHRHLERLGRRRAAAGCRAGTTPSAICPRPAGRSSADCAPPAAAISSARLAVSWPLTWRRSGPCAGVVGLARRAARRAGRGP